MARAAKVPDAVPVVEELHFRSENAFLCLLLNRRTRLIRVIDFRAGALPAKRLFIQSIARRENIGKVITLVEKDEISSWTRVGFVREGTIPGFYKRSDGHLVGCVVGSKTASIEVSDEGQRLAERTINAAKKVSKDIPEQIKGVFVEEEEDSDALSARDGIWRSGHGLGSFDSFGRDAERAFYTCGLKRNQAHHISAEFQDCFGHSLVEILRAPESENDITVLTAGLRSMCETLKARGIVSAFGFAPSEDVPLATTYLAAGFRKTGLLAQGIVSKGRRHDAILWTRKLANPGGEEELEK